MNNNERWSPKGLLALKLLKFTGCFFLFFLGLLLGSISNDSTKNINTTSVDNISERIHNLSSLTSRSSQYLNMGCKRIWVCEDSEN